MFKFNNNHIFTGYLKQLLASFHLPKCRVYTREQQRYHQKYLGIHATLEELKNGTETALGLVAIKHQLENDLTQITTLLADETITSEYKNSLEESKEIYSAELTKISQEILDVEFQLIPELNVLETNYHSSYEVYPNSIEDLPLDLDYNSAMRYIPYIKDGVLQVYNKGSWHRCHRTFKDSTGTEPSHSNFHKIKNNPYEVINYSYGDKILNYTKNLKIQNTVYDSYTHEYLGDFLRFHRDFANINLMPLYNCFSNRACPHLDLAFVVGNNYKVKFKTDQSFEDALYKYYMVPVKFFKDYTIAIDSTASIEVCCCIYNEYHNADSDFMDVPKLTYQCFSDLQFKTPVLYSGVQKLNPKLFTKASDLCQHEDDLKLILKIPTTTNSSIVILEGDYTRYNDMTFTTQSGVDLTPQETDLLINFSGNNSSAEISGTLEDIAAQKAEKLPTKHTNKTVINYDNLDACKFLTDKLITPLQLLRTNTGESYPFADRLVEYLVGNVITVNETIADNVKRAKTVISYNCNPKVYPMDPSDGIWEPILQCLVYDYINEAANINDINHDILGFIDKDVEKNYTAAILKKDSSGKVILDSKTNKPVVAASETIANIDIYKD